MDLPSLDDFINDTLPPLEETPLIAPTVIAQLRDGLTTPPAEGPKDFFQLPGIPPLFPGHLAPVIVENPSPEATALAALTLVVEIIDDENALPDRTTSPYWNATHTILDQINSWPSSQRVLAKNPNAVVGWKRVFTAGAYELTHTLMTLYTTCGGNFYPAADHLFEAMKLTALEEVMVTIVGQDCYHGCGIGGRPQAVGIAFSVEKDDNIPPSLKAIHTELARSLPTFLTPHHGCLKRWCGQGILMLNAALTVKPGEPGSHKSVWEDFVRKILNGIVTVNPTCIFSPWGKVSSDLISSCLKGVVVEEAAHPSPKNAAGGFVGSNVFIKINQALVKQGKTPIDWQLDDPKPRPTFAPDQRVFVSGNPMARSMSPALVPSPVDGGIPLAPRPVTNATAQVMLPISPLPNVVLPINNSATMLPIIASVPVVLPLTPFVTTQIGRNTGSTIALPLSMAGTK